MKPGNPPAYKRGKGANSGGIFREMRGMSHKANPLNHRGFLYREPPNAEKQWLYM